MILAIALLAPLSATALFYLRPPQTATHNGEIIQAQTTLPAPSWRKAAGGKPETKQWRGKWALLQISESPSCESECRRRLCQMRQLRLMLPGNYFRLHRAWLIKEENGDGNDNTGDKNKNPPPKSIIAENNCGDPRAAKLQTRKVNILQGVEILRGKTTNLPPPKKGLRRKDYIYLTDPAGRLAMRFPPELTPYQIRSDLKRLLKLSKGWRQAR